MSALKLVPCKFDGCTTRCRPENVFCSTHRPKIIKKEDIIEKKKEKKSPPINIKDINTDDIVRRPRGRPCKIIDGEPVKKKDCQLLLKRRMCQYEGCGTTIRYQNNEYCSIHNILMKKHKCATDGCERLCCPSTPHCGEHRQTRKAYVLFPCTYKSTCQNKTRVEGGVCHNHTEATLERARERANKYNSDLREFRIYKRIRDAQVAA